MGVLCFVEGCENDRVVRGLCRKHYMRLRRKGSTDDTRKNARRPCRECEDLAVALGLCDKHYRRERRSISTSVQVQDVLVQVKGSIEAVLEALDAFGLSSSVQIDPRTKAHS